jgi:alpha-ketoglutarate-dependent taurine dioxygenase
MDMFEAACKACAEAYPLAPGDVILVNNRICLHGRAEVGEEHGAKSRWLLRTYGLDTNGLDASHWHEGSLHILWP